MNDTQRIYEPNENIAQPGLALPGNIGQPARRALANAGVARLEDLTAIGEEEIARLHGVGPKAIRLLRQALAAHGLAFAERLGTQG